MEFHQSSRADIAFASAVVKEAPNAAIGNATDQLSSLIADIYDAATDPARWPQVLNEICRYVPGYHADILFQDTSPGSAKIVFAGGADRSQLGLDRYAGLNALLPTMLSCGPGEVISTNDVRLMARLNHKRLKSERRQLHLAETTLAILEKAGTGCTALAVWQHHSQAAMDNPRRERVRRIVPHVRRAILLGKAIDAQKGETEAFTDAFDALSAAIYLLNAHGRIVHANRSGMMLLADSDIVDRRDDRLHAMDPRAELTLQRILVAASRLNEAGVGLKDTAVSMTARDGGRYMAHVMPLRTGLLRQRPPDCAPAIGVFVQRTCLRRPSVAAALTQYFRLTPTELRVLFGVVEVGGVPDVARALGVAEGTVRSHLKRLFAKTGTARQADLVKIVAELAALPVSLTSIGG